MTLLFLLMACDDPCRPGPSPTLEIGSGDSTFAPLSATPLPLIMGNQGGYHLDLAIRTTYLEGRDLMAGRMEGRLDGTVVADGRPWFNLTCAGDVQEATGLRLIADVEPEALAGRTLDVSLEVTDSRGETVTATAQVAVEAL